MSCVISEVYILYSALNKRTSCMSADLLLSKKRLLKRYGKKQNRVLRPMKRARKVQKKVSATIPEK